MHIADLPDGWMATRSTMRAYAQALTAIPRAAGTHDARWRHVSMDPTERGFASSPTALGDGIALTAELDLVDHRILASAGDRSVEFDLRGGPSPHSIGIALVDLAAQAGGHVAPDPDRYADDTPQTYNPDHASAFRDAAVAAVEALNVLNAGIEGEITGPHLWPHGFDIASEWYSDKTVDYNGSEANAQIAAGWYPSETSYVYVNPWPFRDEWADLPLPYGATWNVDGWYGAKLDIPAGGSIEPAVFTNLARTVHQVTSVHLSPEV